MKSLNGKTALITGASRGIGTFIAHALAKKDMHLILVARTADSLEEVASELGSERISVKTIQADIGQRDQLLTLFQRAEAETNGVDVLVNNAGLEIPYPYATLEIEVIDQIIAVNLIAPMVLSRLFLPKMIERGNGHIVNISSLSGLVGTPYDEAYAASKHGLVGFSRSLLLTAIGEGYPIGVSVICPGFISDVGMYNNNKKESGLEAPGILGTSPPENVAKAVVHAIIKNKAEVIVNSKPFRPFLVLQTLSPSIVKWLARKTGAMELYKGFVKQKSANPKRVGPGSIGDGIGKTI